MNIKSLAVVSTFAVFACGAEGQDFTQTPMEESGIPTFDIEQNAEATSDVFGCVVPPTMTQNFLPAFACSRPLVPSRCVAGTDYFVTTHHCNSDTTVVSIHGGRIEENTSKISAEAARRFGWNRYDFFADGTWPCLRGSTNRDILHITATHFNDPAALQLVTTHKRVASIHSSRDLVGYQKGSICVGGLDAVAVSRFITEMRKIGLAEFPAFRLKLINAPQNQDDFPCAGSAGVARTNIVNLGQTGKGLQLELGAELLVHLTNGKSENATLVKIFYDALNVAMAP